MASSPPPTDEPPLHPLAGRESWPWLPKQDDGLLAPHPYCRDCGAVKLVGSSRAYDAGGLENLIGRLVRRLGELGYVVTEAQRRLMSLRLRGLQADDAFGLSRKGQFRLLSSVAGGLLGLPVDVVETYLRSC